MTFKRAHNEEQKQVRLTQIMDVALELYETMPFDKITLAAIGEKLAFTRANLYQYVSSKEEVFFFVLMRDTLRWFDDIFASFQVGEQLSLEQFAEKWAKTLYAHRRVLELFSIFHVVIAKNVPEDILADFIEKFYSRFEDTRKLIASILPSLDTEGIWRFAHDQWHYALGFYPSTFLLDENRQSLARFGHPYTAEDFVQSYKSFLIVLLSGLGAMGHEKQREEGKS